MGLERLILCGLIVAGTVMASHNWRSSDSQENDELAKKDYYPERLQEAFKAYGHCVLYNSMTTTVNNSDIARTCVEVSTIQALLPAMYIELSVTPSPCIEEIYEKLMQTPEWVELEEVFSHFLVKRADERDFCAFLDVFAAPLICAIRSQCPGAKEERMTDGVLAAYYSIQQFLNNGIDTNFRCKKTDIRINPALYEFGTKFDSNMKFLNKGLQCEKYNPTTRRPTTASTTTQSPSTTTWNWFSGSGKRNLNDDDESSFGKWFGSSGSDMSTFEDTKDEPSTTTGEPTTVRVRLNRRQRHRKLD